jgi:hypothetical protein
VGFGVFVCCEGFVEAVEGRGDWEGMLGGLALNR